MYPLPKKIPPVSTRVIYRRHSNGVVKTGEGGTIIEKNGHSCFSVLWDGGYQYYNLRLSDFKEILCLERKDRSLSWFDIWSGV